ncbi:MAG: hypothetical protein QXD49_05275, partial [Archaeoglobaceae archaeon]
YTTTVAELYSIHLSLIIIGTPWFIAEWIRLCKKEPCRDKHKLSEPTSLIEPFAAMEMPMCLLTLLNRVEMSIDRLDLV